MEFESHTCLHDSMPEAFLGTTKLADQSSYLRASMISDHNVTWRTGGEEKSTTDVKGLKPTGPANSTPGNSDEAPALNPRNLRSLPNRKPEAQKNVRILQEEPEG